MPALRGTAARERWRRCAATHVLCELCMHTGFQTHYKSCHEQTHGSATCVRTLIQETLVIAQTSSVRPGLLRRPIGMVPWNGSLGDILWMVWFLGWYVSLDWFLGWYSLDGMVPWMVCFLGMVPWMVWFYSGSYPLNCWRGILLLCRHQERHWVG